MKASNWFFTSGFPVILLSLITHARGKPVETPDSAENFNPLLMNMLWGPRLRCCWDCGFLGSDYRLAALLVRLRALPPD